MKNVDFSQVPKILNSVIDGLTQARGACDILIHQHQDPRWKVIRNALTSAHTGVAHVATFPLTKVTPVKKDIIT